MITLRPAAERFHSRLGWLDSHHTFSFAEHYDPAHMGFRALRVLNDDTVAPGRGFGRHPHRDMEIISYVLDGALAHEDSIGNGSTIRPGDVQRMTAGTGVLHSERNASTTDPVHFLQIWLVPSRRGLPPGYEQKAFSNEERRGKLRLVASPDGREGSVTVHQDVALYAGLLEPGERVIHTLAPGRSAWVHVARGDVAAGETRLQTGDGAALEDESSLVLAANAPTELLVFDLG